MKKADAKNMHLHNRRVKWLVQHYRLNEVEARNVMSMMDNHLPHGYTKEIVAMAKESGLEISRTVVRLVKMGKTANPQVFKLLVRLAAEKKANEVAVRELVKENS